MSYLGFIAEKAILYSTLSVPKFHKIEEVQIILSLNQHRKMPLMVYFASPLHCSERTNIKCSSDVYESSV